MTQKTKAVTAIVKGVAHATLIPVLIMILINYVFSGNFGIVAATFYIGASFVIYKNSNKVIARLAFNYTVLAFITFMLILISIISITI